MKIAANKAALPQMTQPIKPHGSLCRNMVILITLILLLMIVVTIIVGSASAYLGLVDTVKANLLSMGQLTDQTFSFAIANIKEDAKEIAAKYDTLIDSQVAPSEALIHLKELSTNNKFLEAAIVSPNGNILTNNNILLDELPDQDCVKSALNGQTVLSSSALLGDNVRFLVAVPCTSGCLVMTLDETYFSSLIQNIVVGKSGNIFMIDSQGVMIANIRPNLVHERQNFIEIAKTDKSYASAARVYAKMTEKKNGVDQYKYGGMDRMCLYGSVSGSDGWSYGIAAPTKELFSEIYPILFSLIVGSSLIVAIGIFLISRYAIRLTKPIAAISKRMQKLAEGDLHSSVTVYKRNDEVGCLSQGFQQSLITQEQYIQDIAKVLNWMVHCDLTVDPDASLNYVGDYKQLYDSLCTLQESLNKAFREISHTSKQVFYGASQVASGSQALANGCSTQAIAVERITETINKISTVSEHNAKTTIESEANANAAGVQAQKCNQQMQETADAMEKMNHSSMEIGKIIKTIEDIAFQTNILAVNYSAMNNRVSCLTSLILC